MNATYINAVYIQTITNLFEVISYKTDVTTLQSIFELTNDSTMSKINFPTLLIQIH